MRTYSWAGSCVALTAQLVGYRIHMLIQIKNTVLIYHLILKNNVLFYYFILILLYLYSQLIQISTITIIVIFISIINKLLLKKQILFKIRVCYKPFTGFQSGNLKKNYKYLGFDLKLQPNELTIVSHSTLCS